MFVLECLLCVFLPWSELPTAKEGLFSQDILVQNTLDRAQKDVELKQVPIKQAAISSLCKDGESVKSSISQYVQYAIQVSQIHHHPLPQMPNPLQEMYTVPIQEKPLNPIDSDIVDSVIDVVLDHKELCAKVNAWLADIEKEQGLKSFEPFDQDLKLEALFLESKI